ncbi:Anaphase-promoting complex subunit CDC26 [Mizuhopecten yessoensis]|uniref:Anaphase-promoting complex subunit CDC26 n=1 Tax=Mizuhopecten yessoensis TaxID=6573 RepID=A0A210R505_MIZYE|nr:Anaphase-promoting complex subunit CDC26 [Mizuhopecten yessoensis]
MMRRNPTRIELKLDDFQEYTEMKREKEEQNKQKQLLEQIQPPSGNMDSRSRTEMVHERIGYDPKPLPQPSRLPIH